MPTPTKAPAYPCPECGGHGRPTKVLAGVAAAPGTVTITLHCDKCGHEWTAARRVLNAS